MSNYIKDVEESQESLIRDKARLDWLECQSNGDNWIARPSTTGRGFRLHNTMRPGFETAREAIDAAMRSEAQ